MALPVTLRYAFARLRPLNNPWVLAPACLALMTMIFLWEYAQNPDRFGRYRSADDSSQADLTGLSPLEQALLADIDNISALQQSIPEEDAATAGSPATADLSLLQRLFEEDTGEEAETSTEQTVAQYLDGYGFLRGNSRNTSPAPGSGSVFSRNPRSTPPPSLTRSLLAPPANPGEQPLSALALVMQQQNAQQAGGQNTSPLNRLGAEGAEGDRPNGLTGNAPIPGQGFSGQGFGNTPRPPQGSPLFLPAVPQMSPPPGTTGYRPPAAYVPPAPTPSTPLNLTPGAGTTPITPITPTFSPGGVVTPQPVVPPLPTGTSGSVPPAGFIGDGYINTFSNPTGAP